jgi:hypothetical protein
MSPSAISLLSLLFVCTSASLPQFIVPNFSDLTIKTRRTVGDRIQTEETLYLQGSRQRSENVLFRPKSSIQTTIISQCDQRRRLYLNAKDKLYSTSPIQDWTELKHSARSRSQIERSGAVVNVTIDSADTGERRKFGSYEARRVKTITRVEPGPGAVMEGRVTEVDGWYIDLPGFGSPAPLIAYREPDRQV